MGRAAAQDCFDLKYFAFCQRKGCTWSRVTPRSLMPGGLHDPRHEWRFPAGIKAAYFPVAEISDSFPESRLSAEVVENAVVCATGPGVASAF